MSHPRYFYLYSLGCPKNLVDSEWVCGQLIGAGWRATAESSEADVILINTCAFIESAVQESIDAILTLHQEAPHAKIVVTGCLPLRYGRQLLDLLPEVETFFLSRRMEEVTPGVLDRALNREGWIQPRYGVYRGTHAFRVVSTPFYTAYVKIADGCNRRCAFCTLPRIRGRYRSRSMEVIVQEVTHLVAQGVREIILVAQDTAAYGQDLGEEITLARLMERLGSIDGLQWLKLLYLYPDVQRVDTSLIEVMIDYPNICPVVDVPIQHASPSVLTRMRRPKWSSILRVLRRLKRIPDLHLRSTVMVGFPGESEREFQDLCAFIEDGWFDNLGVFTYSDEEGTRSYTLPDKLPEDVKKQRLNILMEIQQGVSLAKNRLHIGSTLPVLVEGQHEESELLLKGRTAFQYPEIDGCVIINKGSAEAGEIVSVRITDAVPYDLIGEIVSKQSSLSRLN